jgi:hypothetical protein
MNVGDVGKPSEDMVTFKTMKEFTLERNHIHVSNVGKPLLNPVTLKNIQGVTL